MHTSKFLINLATAKKREKFIQKLKLEINKKFYKLKYVESCI